MPSIDDAAKAAKGWAAANGVNFIGSLTPRPGVDTEGKI